jgi:tripartite-type tricarboxylate transporter receptor subunit TctC
MELGATHRRITRFARAPRLSGDWQEEIRVLNRRCLVLGALALMMTACSLPGMSRGTASKYPERAITMIVPYAAGGSTDLVARKIADMSKDHISQPISVVNRPGGSATVGVLEALRGAPDGHTLGYATSAALAIQPHITEVAYKGPESYKPIAKIAEGTTVVIVKSDSPWKNMKDFVDYGKSNPGALRVGVATRGGVGHLDLEELKILTGADFTFVPLGGGGESIPAVLGGHIEATTTSASSVIGHVQAGTIRIIGIPAEKRSALYPDVPTFKDQGYDITRSEYHMMIAPQGTPDQVITLLQDMVQKITDDPAFKKFADDAGQTVDYRNAADAHKQLAADYSFYGPVVQKLGLVGS